MNPQSTVDRRTVLRGVGATALVAASGCLGWNDESDTREVPISVRNRTGTERDVAIIVHDVDRDERLVETVATTPANDEYDVEFTADRYDGEWPHAWVMVRLDSLEGFDDFEAVEGPSNPTETDREAEWDLPDDDLVAAKRRKLIPYSVAGFWVRVREDEPIHLSVPTVDRLT